jgi:hypothetical protein
VIVTRLRLDLSAHLLHEGSMKESDLYAPIKAHFEAQGYEVKGEVGAADVMARRGAEPAVIIELKLAFSLTLFHQALERLKLVDDVYIAVLRPEGKAGMKRLKANLTLCRRLGLGLLTLRPRDFFVEQHCAPGPYAPRKNLRKAKRIIKAFDRLEGDPNEGGATRHGLVTGYRQDALKCATYLAHTGPEKGAIVARATGVPPATALMRNNVYGWFEKVETGVYALTPAGRKGLEDWS